MRREGEEEFVVRDRTGAEEIGALSEIIEEERRIDDCVPGETNRQRAEMAEVGVHRLAPGDDQHQRAEDQQRLHEMRVRQKPRAVDGIEGGEDLGFGVDLGGPEDGDGEEPDEHDRPEQRADAGGALELDGEERNKEAEGDRNDRAGKARHGDAQALHRGEHADRRRDHPVADQEPGACHKSPRQHAGARIRGVVQEAVEREHAALAVVLRPQHQEGVFDRDDEGQRPDDERDGAERILGRPPGGHTKYLIHGVEGRGADVAVNDAERPERQRNDAARRRMVMRQPGGLGATRPIDEERHGCGPIY